MPCQTRCYSAIISGYEYNSPLHIVFFFFLKNVLPWLLFFSLLLKQVKSFIEQLGLQNMVFGDDDEG